MIFNRPFDVSVKQVVRESYHSARTTRDFCWFQKEHEGVREREGEERKEGKRCIAS